jgi:hydrogenase expression/formation protein HypC
MCLAIPAQVLEVTGNIAQVSVEGALREVHLGLVDGVDVGDYVLVHAGFALERWSEDDVREWRAMLDGTWSGGAG